ncbi:MAG TPA: DUF4105 domain-containing protein, partial [Gemmatimonadaceae bacterium]|nr:DUF4105 domain-containing protein [Gemmatimonadaceae bacterium]
MKAHHSVSLFFPPALVAAPFTVHFLWMKALASILLLSALLGFEPVEAQVLPANPAFAPSATVPSNEPGANLTVYLLTLGWGNEVWERFGHNAIWIKDRTRGTDITYNWGMFSFDEPHFLARFLTGDTRYWMQAFDLDTMLAEYKRRNRSVLAQELNLTPAQRLKLQQFVQWNEQPQNKFYRY